MSNTESLPPGLYHIVVADPGHVDNQLLSREGDRVTILPPNVVPEADQVWQVRVGRDGNVIIERPARNFPSTYLTYKDAPQKPKQGDLILTRPSEFPPNEWHLTIAPGFRFCIRVAGSDLGIGVSPFTVHPPILVLSADKQLQWVFARI